MNIRIWTDAAGGVHIVARIDNDETWDLTLYCGWMAQSANAHGGKPTGALADVNCAICKAGFDRKTIMPPRAA